MKITRNVQVQLKEGKGKEFIQAFESQILPVLRQQAGFQDELALLDNNRALLISFWDDRKHADMYHNTVYPKLVEKLNPMFQTPPKVDIYEVATTTLHVAA
ncbi:MAG TPA: antibiotic biosynthesis monooxygenase [Candidatus Eisenbacteria bacterium]|nr:antibiotic biosynthesis monooxygenase [Candidatus Eisenbacteria bacterium]